MSKKTVLLTGFEPFNKETINPAWEAVRALDGWSEEGFTVAARQLPCVFVLANEVMARAIEELNPSIVIAVGQAGGRCDLSVERVAINIDDAPILDNQQQQLVDQAVVEGGPAAYFSTLPVKAIARELRAAGLPASVSQTAGTFVCNHVFYGLMHVAAERMERGGVAPMRAGFIHIPYLPRQAAAHPGAPSMALADMVEGLRVAVRTALEVESDVRYAGGATH
ncbi:pyroglutamyl-peptidase I [Pseudoduganella namucuonensis]|uniref:Pyrrolidone-carboxylate peptidase n=1 Tax=Pseudoduganella namucuonensis TaxID=1035707 RepID=A0A1I7F339_9BURK|nr:pyroglutamyl-peptidase I [Pseudoduganella namucuonensis]SFU30525.1 pyroglutamyl-peptidase I Cysteine peptidase. MEROPS family C15 [Pseudoduganella namucuonensis]